MDVFDQEPELFETYAKEINEIPQFGKGTLCAEYKGRLFRIYDSLIEHESQVPEEFVYLVRAYLRTALSGSKELVIDAILEERTNNISTHSEL